jgi:hypothetical protein
MYSVDTVSDFFLDIEHPELIKTESRQLLDKHMIDEQEMYCQETLKAAVMVRQIYVKFCTVRNIIFL